MAKPLRGFRLPPALAAEFDQAVRKLQDMNIDVNTSQAGRAAALMFARAEVAVQAEWIGRARNYDLTGVVDEVAELLPPALKHQEGQRGRRPKAGGKGRSG